MTKKLDLLRQLVGLDIQKGGPTASTMVRAGLLAEILDEHEAMLDATKAARRLLEWLAERASKIAYEQYRQSEGVDSNLTFEIAQLTDAMHDGLLASYRDQFESAVAKATGAA